MHVLLLHRYNNNWEYLTVIMLHAAEQYLLAAYTWPSSAGYLSFRRLPHHQLRDLGAV